jgi:hypothetical protein
MSVIQINQVLACTAGTNKARHKENRSLAFGQSTPVFLCAWRYVQGEV